MDLPVDMRFSSDLFHGPKEFRVPKASDEEGKRPIREFTLFRRVDADLLTGGRPSTENRLCSMVGDLLQHRSVLGLVIELRSADIDEELSAPRLSAGDDHDDLSDVV